MTLLLRGGNRLNQRINSGGFALPTILIASVVMLIVLLVSVSSTTAVRTAIQSQYYAQLAQAAGDAGVAYAQACMNATGGVPKWSDAKPLTPSTDCYGNSAASPVARALVVAGGGGGGSNMGGGGGAGGVLSNDQYTLAVQSYPVTVGNGGAGAAAGTASARGSSGANSVFGTMTAIGGGGGGSNYATNSSPPANGGSGGGNAGCNQTTGPSTGTAGQGYGGAYSACYFPSGGGGAGGPGAVNPGNGGPGVLNDILGRPYYWGGGGGGSGYTKFGGNGGIGGGGGGAIGVTTGGAGLNNGSPGTDGNVITQANVPGGNAGTNTGGGGGGGSHYNSNNKGGNGGSGIVVVSYPTESFTATGGTITTSGTNTIHTFTSSGTFEVTAVNSYSCPTDPRCSVVVNDNVRSSFSVPAPVLGSTVRALIVAGGGSGGGSTGGGGGGGGVIERSDIALGVTDYPVIVGTGGGVPGNKLPGKNGENSSFNNLIAIGGGGGGYSTGSTGGNGQDGGSGGGGQNYYGTNASGAGTIGQGYDGGPLYTTSAAGGGGAGSGGSSHPSSNLGGDGGNGILSNISGAGIFYSGGGGAGNGGSSTLGGGGNGSTSSGVGSPGTANTGGGGGGGWGYAAGNGGAGGSGVVIIRYPTGSMTATGGTITTPGPDTIHTFTSSGTFDVTSVITKKVIANSGYVEILRSSTGSVWRTYNQPAAQSAVVPDLCSGATGSVYGWNNALVRTPDYYLSDTSALAIGVSSGNTLAGPAHFRKDFSVAKAGSYTLKSAGDSNLQWFMDGSLIASWNSKTESTQDVTLSAGCHALIAKATNNTVLPDAFDFRASLKPSGGSSPIVVTDSSWRSTVGSTRHYSTTGYYAAQNSWLNAIDLQPAITTNAGWTTSTGDEYARFIASPQNFNYAGVANASPPSSWTNFRDGKTITVGSNTDVRVSVLCDDDCVLYMDGNVVIASAPYSGIYTATVSLTAGTHQFGLALYNGGTAAGRSAFSFAAVRASDGVSLSVSDVTWQAANYWNQTNQDPVSYDANFLPNPTPGSAGSARVLAVGGGGGGGANMGGGGGGGGVVYNSAYTLRAGSYDVTVGYGGSGAPAATGAHNTIPGTNGGNSVFDTIIAYGGGRGGLSPNTIAPGVSYGMPGGSGGGASGYNNNGSASGAVKGGLGVPGQGSNGGNQGGVYYSGGGGGAGGVGASGNSTPNGGPGVANSILGTSYYWGGGGGGSGYSIVGGSGGIGGGGGGAIGVTTGGAGLNNGSPGTNGCTSCQANVPGGNAGANTGGGGGSGSHYNSNNKGGDGGSGIVIISYVTGTITATGGTITTSGGYTIHRFTSSGTFTVTSVP